jgi:hypothetical protein
MTAWRARLLMCSPPGILPFTVRRIPVPTTLQLNGPLRTRNCQASGWGGTARVKILAVGDFACFDFELSGADAGTTFGALPSAAYTPASDLHRPIAITGTNAGEARLEITTADAVNLAGLPSVIPANVDGTVVYPLD